MRKNLNIIKNNILIKVLKIVYNDKNLNNKILLLKNILKLINII